MIYGILGSIAIVFRFFYWAFVQAWPVGIGLAVWSLCGGSQGHPWSLMAGALAFGAGAVARQLLRHPAAREQWRERIMRAFGGPGK